MMIAPILRKARNWAELRRSHCRWPVLVLEEASVVEKPSKRFSIPWREFVMKPPRKLTGHCLFLWYTIFGPDCWKTEQTVKKNEKCICLVLVNERINSRVLDRSSIFLVIRKSWKKNVKENYYSCYMKEILVDFHLKLWIWTKHEHIFIIEVKLFEIELNC